MATVIGGNWLLGLDFGNSIVAIFEKKRKFAECVDICHALFYPTVFEKHALSSIDVRLQGSVGKGPADILTKRSLPQEKDAPSSDSVGEPGKITIGGEPGKVLMRKAGKLPKIHTALSSAFDASVNTIPESPLRETPFVPSTEADDWGEFMRNALKSSQTIIPMLKTQLCVPFNPSSFFRLFVFFLNLLTLNIQSCAADFGWDRID